MGEDKIQIELSKSHATSIQAAISHWLRQSNKETLVEIQLRSVLGKLEKQLTQLEEE